MKRPLQRSFRLPQAEFQRLHRRARRAQKRNQMEVVGLLAVHRASPSVLRLKFLQNRAHAPCTWQLHRKDILLASQTCGARLTNCWIVFSHPVSSAVLGPRDRRNTPTRWTHLVYDVCALGPRLYLLRWQDGRRRVQELHLTVERSRRRGVARTDKVPVAITMTDGRDAKIL
jgi:hypothetical protein